MCKTNFEKWTESPQALLDSMRDLSKYMSLIEMGLVDFEASRTPASYVSRCDEFSTFKKLRNI